MKKLKLLMVSLVMVVVMGCSAAQLVNQQALGDAQSFSEFLSALKAVTIQDVQTALTDVHAKGDQDLAALQCYPALVEFLQSDVSLKNPTVDGVISANQLKRDILLGISSGNSPVKLALRKLHTACAAYVSDEKRFAAEFVVMVGAASHGVPALPGLPGALGGILGN